jgi:hypothetical protein
MVGRAGGSSTQSTKQKRFLQIAAHALHLHRKKKQRKGTESFPSLFHLHEYREKNRNNPGFGGRTDFR